MRASISSLRPTGPWTDQVEARLPCDDDDGRTCRAIIPHAEMGGRRSVVLSIFQGPPPAKGEDDEDAGVGSGPRADDGTISLVRVTLPPL